MERRRVVITGLGAVTPIGLTAGESWQAVKNGVCGIGPITHYDPAAQKVKLAAEVKGFDPVALLGRQESKRMGRFTQFAVAAARAIERVSGVYPGIKWTNDLVLGKKKLCGILTEIGIEAESREVDYAVVGIGINCAHAELPPEVAAMSADLETATGKKPDRSRLAAELVRSLYEMEQALFTQKDAWLAEFSAHCVTIGQDVKLVRGDEVQFAHADGIDGEAALRVTYPDGTAGVIASGEVSVRGMYGYT